MTLNSAGLNPSKYDKTEVKVKYIIFPLLNWCPIIFFLVAGKLRAKILFFPGFVRFFIS